MKTKLTFLLLFFSFLTKITWSQQGPIASTAFGKVAGALTSDGEVEIYKGIPFAAPPIGSLRWKKPMPP
ncbi:MAG: carboxylesterase family protein, partial [Chitinophagaceae bacterium]